MADHKYKLTYFNGRGRAEVARYLFALAGVDFEDHRVGDEWSDVKKKAPYGQLPVLEYDGTMYCQSEAIYRFLARQFGFYGKDSLDGLLIDQILGVIGDVRQEASKITWVLKGEEKEKAIETLRSQSVPKLLKFLEAQLGHKKWFLGDSVSLADALAFEFLTGPVTRIIGNGWEEHSPSVKAFVDNFAAEPAIAKHIAARPETPF